jgi:mRNA interferase MazF/mRNA interferase ChpB
MKYTPKQGDIVWLDFDPSSGREIMKRRPAYVISQKVFNAHTELAIVAPITSVIRGIKLEVVLPKGLSTVGAILLHQLKSIDFNYRNIEYIETAPKDIIKQARQVIHVITG